MLLEKPMLVKKRKNLIDKFSSFICFTGGDRQVQLSWKVDTRLEKCMQLKIEEDLEAKESFWAQYFLKILLIQHRQENENLSRLNPDTSLFLAHKHLSAYLQEACLKVAKDIYHEFNYIQYKYSLEEFFQIANIAANSPDKFFKSFNFERNKINIEAYAITAFKRFVRNQIYRQDLEARRTRFSSYGLLKDLSAGELNDSLRAKNLQSEQIVLHRLAWQCFYELLDMTANRSGRSRSPSREELSTIADYFNQRCSQLNIPDFTATDMMIYEMLETCIDAAKSYRNKQYLYFDESYYVISDPAPSKWDLLIQQEESQQLKSIFDSLFKNMPKQSQIVFQLWQGLNLTQTEIADILKYKYSNLQKQYQVARQIKKSTRYILKGFVSKWNQTNPEVYINDEKDIERIKSAFEKCLQVYCQKSIYSILDQIIQQFSDWEKANIISSIKQNQLTVPLLSNDVTESRLLKLFKQYIETSMDLEKKSLSKVNYKIADVVNEWIHIKQG